MVLFHFDQDQGAREQIFRGGGQTCWYTEWYLKLGGNPPATARAPDYMWILMLTLARFSALCFLKYSYWVNPSLSARKKKAIMCPSLYNVIKDKNQT